MGPSPVSPDLEALASQLHGATGHPKKEDAIVLQDLNKKKEGGGHQKSEEGKSGRLR
jgi:hypothetical protein